ncbi:uncharacterized protein LOC127841933 isoform X2 [Dreissena polymorpha]|nr:uncharacterized protein LOC127841933 isoform X2 [Dreissena polymorpha]XP_052227031.1 uncharacterized protein LOC127841933 isoform X2 [Dreissena polymorpha]XP_052227032.1 uncharacterized protein LOC127841933 isoform X2 [Dreissena polymorpha]XP_052227033.1 uncharacterized protein LOC127841933 isoform X2 [Dreissena polymorpha]
MCNFQRKSWTLAMQHCLNLSGTPVSYNSVPSLTRWHLNGTFWTSDYATRIPTSDNPVDCEYRTLAKGNTLSESTFGNCLEIRHYICCDNIMIKSCVKNGTWREASKCTENYPIPPEKLPNGDYWLRGAYGNQLYTFTGGLPNSIDRCGILGIDGNPQFVSKANCATSQYSFCEVDNYTRSELSVCGSTNVTNQSFTNAPSFASYKQETLTTTIMPINENTSTESILPNNSSSSSVSRSLIVTTQPSSNITLFGSQNTERLTVQIMPINENTSTESIVRSHAQSSSGSALGISLGVSFSIVVIVIITTFGVCVYRRRYRRKPQNKQVSVQMNALYDVSSQNETPRKPEHQNESYEYAVPSRLRKNDINQRGVKGIEHEIADLNAYSKVIPRTKRNVNTMDLQSRKENNTGFSGDATVIKAENAVEASNEYDFSATTEPINMNVYGHLCSHDHDDAYDVASCTQKQQTQEGMNDYDRLDKRSLQ